MKNLLVAQSGGPTSAINATLAGVIENALSSPSVDKIYGSVNGIQGVLNENLIDLKTKITNVSELDLLCQTPASALGSCRVKLKDPAVCADEYETIISVLRKYSIDELPQLFNILRGDMSVVGNRPLPLYEAERLTSDEYIERFMCPSGLTGLWQVEKRGQAGKLSPEQRKQLDIEYARKMSPWFDLKIILRTLTAFIQKENV